jgi:hypothetical protein
MKLIPVAALALTLSLAGTCFAQQTNEQDRKDAQAQTKQDRKADKAQAHADKEAHKALKSDKVKNAARAQDKADQEAAKTPDR